MTYFSHAQSGATTRPVSVTLFVVSALMATVWASPVFAQASNFTNYEPPETGQSVSVQFFGEEQTDTTADASEVETIVAPLGVADCAELKAEAPEDAEPDIRFSWNGVTGEVEEVRIREFVATETPPECRIGNDPVTDQCDRLTDPGPDNDSIERNLTAIPPNIRFTLPALMRYRDDVVEECAFQSSTAMSAQQTGDAGMTDATDGSADAGGTQSGLPDIIYNPKLFYQQGTGSDNFEAIDAAIYLDRTRPPAPGTLSIQATQNQIKVESQYPSQRTADVEQFYLFYSTQQQISAGTPGEELQQQVRVKVIPGNRTIDDQNAGENFTATVSPNQSLQPGSTLYAGVATRDKAGNFGRAVTPDQPSTVAEATGFGSSYTDAGGSETGGCGCSQSGNGLSMFGLAGMLALLGLGVFRRRGLAIGIVVAAGVMALSVPASAQSDISGNVELRFGPYYPSIDSEFSGGAQPFQERFGSNGRVVGELKFDRFVWQGHGKLGVGGSIGYTNFTGEAEVSTPGGGDAPDIDAETKFQLVPLRAHVFYRWDYLNQEFDIPVVPRVEAGLDWFMWRIRDGSGNTETFGNDGPKAQGATAGYHGSAGIEINLNPLDRQSAATFDYNWGVNRTYLFALYELARVNDFGGEGFNLSDETWRIGLAFEF